VDPTALHITDRVRLLTGNAAARRRSSKQRASPGGLPVNVLQYCTAAGISGAASQLVLQHVKATRISSTPESLGPYLVSYKRLVQVSVQGGSMLHQHSLCRQTLRSMTAVRPAPEPFRVWGRRW
jgi:hypothetical protein